MSEALAAGSLTASVTESLVPYRTDATISGLASQSNFEIPRTQSVSSRIAPGILCIFFVLAGCLFIPRLGIEPDETLFIQAIYQPREELYSLPVGTWNVPVMLMSYVGALKAWVYTPILRILPAGLFALRFPVVLAGAATLWLFFHLLRRLAGERAAWIGCALLAADSTYLLTLTFDWGPVAFQHLLCLGGALLLVRFYQDKREWALGGAAFLFGIAMWDKALAVWLISGIAVALLVTAPRLVLKLVTPRRVGLALGAFLLGAAPLVVYNSTHDWDTFLGARQRETAPLMGKVLMLRDTAHGSGLFGWLTADDWQTPQPHAPSGLVQSASMWVSETAGHPRKFLLYEAFLLALLLMPLAGWGNIRLILFSLIAMAVAWIQMAITANTGGSAHHIVLLWPLPHMAVAAAFAGASRRLGRAGLPVLAALLLVTAASGALTINEYYAKAVRNGGAQVWNNGVLGLADYLKSHPARVIYSLDWGIVEPVRLLTGGRLLVVNGSDPIADADITQAESEAAMRMVSQPEGLFVIHTGDFEVFPGRSARLVEFAAARGYGKETVTTISDPFGRKVFEVYRFRQGQ
jgi:4-amino-4-deoxy-L-arabinose transferase-like glycosyltransferase